MIVNTKVLNYRFALGTLIVAILVLAATGFSKYDELKSENDYLVHEKKLLQQELSEFIDRYDELGSSSITLKRQFEETQKLAKTAFDSLKLLKANEAILLRYRQELMFLKRKNLEFINDSLRGLVSQLQSSDQDNALELDEMDKATASLNTEVAALKNILNEAGLIRANSFKARVFRNKNSGEKTETKKAAHAEFIELCFVLAENPLAEEGNRKLHVQILDPNNNVVNDKGAIYYEDSSLIYSELLLVDYKQEAKEICAQIHNDDSFKRGVYYMTVYDRDRLLGSTQIVLD